MRLSNRSRMPVYRFILTVINVILVIGTILFLFDFLTLEQFPTKKLFLVLLPLSLLIIYYRMGRSEFHYDSNGEVLVIRNKGIMHILKEKNDEFPKYKLISYKITGAMLFKRLLLRISSKKKGQIVLKYDISFLNHQEIKDLKISLRRILKQNEASATD